MRASNATPGALRPRAIAAFASLALAGLVVDAASAQADTDETYEWSAVLMSFDAAGNTAVLEARFESYVDIEGLDGFAEGGRLTLVWTGRNWAAGIRGLAADPELEPGTLSLPVEFVSTTRNDQYLNFRVPVPDSAVETLAASAILSLRHYNDIS